MSTPPGGAVLGGGVFSRAVHIPTLYRLGANILCVWSRSENGAKAALESWQKANSTMEESQKNPDVYFGVEGLSKLLKREDVHFVCMALPIGVQPKIILQALAAGKHVLSEKAIAPSVKIANELLHEYERKYSHLLWSVAENYRYEAAFCWAQKQVHLVGRILSVHLERDGAIGEGNKYFYKGAWRQDSSAHGGIFVDILVHDYAALSTIAGRADLNTVSAVFSDENKSISGPDSIKAAFKFKCGALGSITMLSEKSPRSISIVVKGTKGTLRVQHSVQRGRHGYTVQVEREGMSELNQHCPYIGIDAEFKEFLELVQHTIPGAKPKLLSGSPYEALADLEFVEALLRSHQKTD